MNIVVPIREEGGREAIPVRAIPALTRWDMDPVFLARALAQQDRVDRAAAIPVIDLEGVADLSPQNGELNAYRLEFGKVRSIDASYWSDTEHGLTALSDRISATQITGRTGYQDWKRESPKLLRAGAFVWKDEFAMFLSRNKRLGWRDVIDYCELDIPDSSLQEMIMEGFEATSSAAEGQTSARGTHKKLTPLQEKDVRVRLEGGETVASLAHRFGVSRPTIDRCRFTRPAPSNDPFGQAARATKKK